MTCCLAMRLDEGLLFLADTRTNAGVDNVSTFRKIHVFTPAPDRVFVIQSAGNLATTQQVVDSVRRDLTSGAATTLATIDNLFEAALYIGRLSQEVARGHQDAFANPRDSTATFILGGQVGTEAPDVLLVCPEGNCIRASDDRPFLQIGESKDSRFLLDLAVETDVDLTTATKVALGSMMSTATANLSVGPPHDMAIYRNDAYAPEEARVEADSPILAQLRDVWRRYLVAAVHELPHIAKGEIAVLA